MVKIFSNSAALNDLMLHVNEYKFNSAVNSSYCIMNYEIKVYYKTKEIKVYHAFCRNIYLTVL